MKIEREGMSGCYKLYFDWLKENRETLIEGGGIYSPALVSWLMIYQRLQEGASLWRAVDELDENLLEELAGKCKRKLEKRVSNNTGGYSQARKLLSQKMASEITDELYTWLNQHPEVKQHNYGRPIFSVDGAVIELLASKELKKAYPPFQRGHYPLMRIVVCQDLETGLAVRPEFGAYTGKNQCSEVQLVKRMFSRMPKDGVFIGDRNFGIFSVTHCAKECGRDVVFRLSDDRAKKILGRKPQHGIDTHVLWSASNYDCNSNPELPKNALVKGRVICMNVQSCTGAKITPLYLFTTLLDEPASSVIEMYGLRWNVEIDLRTLKQTVSMDMLKVKSLDMAVKELFFGICAYNLVVAVRHTVAQQLKLTPRALSFKRILGLTDIYAPKIAMASPQQRQKLMRRFWDAVKAAKHPNRSKRRVEPRAIVRHRRQKYPNLTVSRKTARKQILRKN